MLVYIRYVARVGFGLGVLALCWLLTACVLVFPFILIAFLLRHIFAA